jgi:hypothetical protein
MQFAWLVWSYTTSSLLHGPHFYLKQDDALIGRLLHENPELMVMGSCVLVMLMKDEDVYIMKQLLLSNIQRAGVLFPMWAMHALNVQKFMDKIKFKPVEQYQAGLERVSQTHPPPILSDYAASRIF